jgi:hypothetical protein
MDSIIMAQSQAKGADPIVVKAILRHESASVERSILGNGGEFAQSMVEPGGRASIGPGQVQLRRARELEDLGYVTRRPHDDARAAALLNDSTAVEYVAGETRSLSDQLHSRFPTFDRLSKENQERLVLIGYNIGWDGPQGLDANVAKYGFARVISDFGYDNQTLDEYQRWQAGK